MWTNNVRFFFAGFIRYQLRERNTDNVRNFLQSFYAWITACNLRQSGKGNTERIGYTFHGETMCLNYFFLIFITTE